ncbi:GGDEF domain-containing protein [Nitrincola tapanii]|uniref:diguanylate cyclase n=1 Tax=Nitrincola tapanii TaxID=1708751 RepID=A0A5A9VYG0_9GAMM|nr:GGDEF domain-containing protein [Nitrincola tapanii]KAA0873577.1 GGDEF domain-containing protein [Nitrincola tapanii]
MSALMHRLLISLFFLLMSFHLGAAPAQPLEQDWQYRWGDSPFTQGIPDWTQEAAPESWHAIDFPSNPPDRQGQQNVWYRTLLPEGQFTDPVLYIYSIDLIAEAYLGSELIYRFGEFDEQGRGQFIGWPWHKIDLPEGYAGQKLHFRIFSDYTDIGLWGEVKIMERSDLLVFILEKSYANLGIAAFCLFIAALALAFAWVQGDQRQFIYLSLFALASAGKLLGETQAVQLVLDAPFFRTYMTAVAYYSMPIWIALLLREWLAGPQARRMAWIAYAHLAYLLAALGAAALNWIHLSITYPIFDLLFSLSLLILLWTLRNQFQQMEANQRWVIAAFSIFALLLLIDMAVAHGFLPWVRVPLSLGALAFAMTLVVIFLHDYSQMQKWVRTLNRSLETQVKARTAALEGYVDKEKQRAEQLTHVQLLDRRVETLIHHLQSSNSTQAAIALIGVELPQLLSPLPISIQPFDPDHTEESLLGTELESGAQVIFIQNINQNSRPCLILTLDPDQLPAHTSKRLLEDFMQRLAERLSFALSSRAMQEALERMSYEDFLTGLRNRRFFDEALARESRLAVRYEHPLAMLMCDIDHFKRFNDVFGHEAGDIALQKVAKILQEHFRETDLPCRYGGEEFVIIMPKADLEAARQRAETLRERVAEESLKFAGQDLGKISISVGIAVWPNTTLDPKDLLNAADRALYRAKEAGRNQVQIALD